MDALRLCRVVVSDEKLGSVSMPNPKDKRKPVKYTFDHVFGEQYVFMWSARLQRWVECAKGMLGTMDTLAAST